MRRLVSFIAALGFLAGTLHVSAEGDASLTDGKPGVIASFHDKSNGNFASLEKSAGSDRKSLYVGSAGGDSRQLVWSTDWGRGLSVFSSKPANGDEFLDSEILASQILGDVAVVLFKLKWDKTDPRKMAFRGWGWYVSDAEFQAWDGSVSFLRSFVKRDGKQWEVYLSVFPETMWHSVRGEKPIGIVIRDKGEYDLIYKKNWEVRVQEGRFLGDKVVLEPNGMTTRAIRYDEEHEVLTTLDGNKTPVFVSEAEWWAWRDAWDVRPLNQKTERWDHQKEMYDRAKRAGLRMMTKGHL
jgi:hypothetical protein